MKYFPLVKFACVAWWLVLVTGVAAAENQTAQDAERQMDRARITAERAAAKAKEKHDGPSRPWDRDSNGKRPWDVALPEQKK